MSNNQMKTTMFNLEFKKKTRRFQLTGMVQNGGQWWGIVQNGGKWWKMVRVDGKWCKIVQNGGDMVWNSAE